MQRKAGMTVRNGQKKRRLNAHDPQFLERQLRGFRVAAAKGPAASRTAQIKPRTMDPGT